MLVTISTFSPSLPYDESIKSIVNPNVWDVIPNNKKTESPKWQPGYLVLDPWLSVPVSQQVWLFRNFC